MNRWWWLRCVFVIALAAILIGAEFWLRHVRSIHGDSKGNEPAVLWAYESPEAGGIISSPCLSENRIFVGAIRNSGLSPRGEVIALDREAGKVVWRFDEGGEMLHMYSSPRVDGERLFIGEGMHANFQCKLYSLDIHTGQKVWSFPVGGHIESTPCLTGDCVIFGAGDAGLYAIDKNNGKPRWHFDKSLHIDSTAAVVGRRVYAGSGVSRRFRETAVFCLDASTGSEIWRTPVDLPAWGSPLADEQHVFIGLANGRLDQSAETPAGALVCLDAASGKLLWRCPMTDGVMSRPARVGENVCVTCRDGYCYLLDQSDGRIIWRRDLGSAIVTNPVFLDGKVFVAASGGLVACLDATSGEIEWKFDVAAYARSEVHLFSTPAVTADESGKHSLYFGAELVTPAGRVPMLYAIRH